MSATGEILGGDLFLKFSTDGGSTYDVVGVVRDVQLTYNTPSIVVSSQGSSGTVKRKAGKSKELTGSVSGLMKYEAVSGEINVKEIITSQKAGTIVKYKYEVTGTPGTGDVTFSGDCLLTSTQFGGPYDGEATFSTNFESTGDITIATAA